MYKVFSGANGEYVAFENEDGFHDAPAQYSREANQGWSQTARLKRDAARLNAEAEDVDEDGQANTARYESRMESCR